ncbi:M23 family metallopeptidase [Candidatus Actinomarina sp.]|nr:M23 family metallopeptidase [Candidatus Actinomarina sp.]
MKSHFYDDWKERRGGGSRLHEGLDVRAPKGAKIVAVAEGIINTVAFSESSGYYIAIDHMNGWLSLYVHLNDDVIGDDNAGGSAAAFAKEYKRGDRVQRGEVIGFVGNSGNAEGTVPHLHFELKYLGNSQDVYEYILKAWNSYEKSKLFPKNTMSLLIY